ncbi:MAG: hypothetical protein ACK518_01525 [bacterium]
MIHVSTKTTNNECTKCIRFFTGPILQYTVTLVYKKEAEEVELTEEGLIKLKKEIIHEQGYK